MQFFWVRSHFSNFGTITDFEMPWDKEKDERKNFCFVTFEREEIMKEALKQSKQTISEVMERTWLLARPQHRTIILFITIYHETYETSNTQVI